MLLSSVNFVAKPKCGKAAKSKEEKSTVLKPQKAIGKEEKLNEPTECPQCRLEAEEENRIFKFPSTPYSSSSSGYASLGSLDSVQNNIGDRVTVATGDDFCLSVDQFYYTIGLRDHRKSDSTCIFRKRVLHTETKENGHIETVVLALDCDQDFYLTTTKDRSLELNYFSTKPSLEIPDERLFLIYYTSVGQSLIQPKHHKNVYLHHIDNVLSVQQLDLNWRCPEEYFFHFNAEPEPPKPRSSPANKQCCHNNNNNNDNSNKVDTECDTESNYYKHIKSKIQKCRPEEIPEKFRIELPTRKPKNKFSVANLFLGCFSGRSHQLTQTEV